jgi:uncharacterized repeat protein (TIGR01451 family)
MMKRVPVLLVIALWAGSAWAQLAVNQNATLAQMLDQIDGPDVSVSNVTLLSPSRNRQYGTFAGGTTPSGAGPVLGLDAGVFLTTGSAASMLGPNDSGGISINNFFTYNDPDLTAIAGNATRDSVVLTLTAVPAKDRLNVRFVFGSDEYPEYVCTVFNDVVGLFLTGPEVPGGPSVTRNVALVPDTTRAIAVNTVNGGAVGSAQTPGNAAPCDLGNLAFYVDNGSGSTPLDNVNVQYDGFTVPITSDAPVVPGESYTLKLAIADAGDAAWDSAVFVESVGSSWAADADLSLSATVADPTLPLGQATDLTLTVGNAGPDDVPQVQVLAPLPAGLSYAADDGNGAYDPATGSWTLASPLPAGGTASLTITVTGAATGSSDIPSQIQSANAEDPDSVPGNGVVNGEDDEAPVSVTVVPTSDLALAKSVDMAGPEVGDSLVYTLEVTNAGPSDASGVAVTDALPAGVLFLAASAGCSEAGGVVTCTQASLASGASTSFDVEVEVLPQPLGTMLVNSAAASADEVDLVPTDNAASATATVSAVRLDKSVCNLSASACSDPADFAGSVEGVPGDVLEYRVTFERFGPPVFDLELADEVPPEAVLVVDAFGAAQDVRVTCPDGSLAFVTTGLVATITFDLAATCPLDTATRADGTTVSEALLSGQAGAYRFRVAIP